MEWLVKMKETKNHRSGLFGHNNHRIVGGDILYCSSFTIDNGNYKIF